MSMNRMLAFAFATAAVLSSCSDERALRDEAGGAAPAGAAVEVGSLAPGFSLVSAEGAEVSLSGFRGAPVLLYFSMGPG